MPIILLLAAALLAILVLLALRRPAAFRVARSMHIAAPPERIEFLLEPGIGGTGVTWAMSGRSPFIARLMGLLFDTDRMVGRALERGLAALRTQAEAAGAAKAA